MKLGSMEWRKVTKPVLALGGNLGSRTLASQEMTLLEGIPLTPQEFTCLDFTIVGSFVLKEPFDLSQ